MSEPSEQRSNPELHIPMRDVVGFVRQLSHDLRNNLNAAELQSAYLNEVATDAEVKSEVQRLRGMLSTMGSSLQRLTGSLAQIKLTEMTYQAADLMEDLQSKIAGQFPAEADAIVWNVQVSNTNLQIDPQLLQQAFVELFENAFRHERGKEPLQAGAEIAGDEFRFTLREPKKAFARSTDDWGREPFQQVGHGHYGLGLPRVRSIIEAHRGQFSARYDSPSSSLVTTVVLPLG